MPAQDIQTLYLFRSTVEPVIQAALIAAGLPDGKVYVSRSGVTQATPCISVQLQLGANNGHRFNPPTLSYWIFDQWACTVNIELLTNRASDAAQNVHEAYEALIRMSIVDVFARVNPSLDYHAFAEAPRDAGSNYTVDTQNNIDISRLSFNSVLAIKRDAWPSA